MQDAPHRQENSNSHRVQKKIRRTATEWERLILEYQTSGLTQRDYCEQHDVPYSSFTNWFAKLKKNKPALSVETTPADLFVELSAETPFVNSTITDWDVELAFSNGTILRLKQR